MTYSLTLDFFRGVLAVSSGEDLGIVSTNAYERLQSLTRCPKTHPSSFASWLKLTVSYVHPRTDTTYEVSWRMSNAERDSERCNCRKLSQSVTIAYDSVRAHTSVLILDDMTMLEGTVAITAVEAC